VGYSSHIYVVFCFTVNVYPHFLAKESCELVAWYGAAYDAIPLAVMARRR